MMKRLIVVFLATMLGLQSVAIVPAQAGLITTGEIIQGDASLASDRDRLNALMQREDIRQEFRRQGVDPNEAAARVAALSDAEVAEITARIDELPAGQSAIGVIVGAVVLIFIVLLITDLLCLTSVFNFTRCATR
ncbi:MAG TPA: PA2779 family protein [Kiloniellaceae bacterium]